MLPPDVRQEQEASAGEQTHQRSEVPKHSFAVINKPEFPF
jgi:hypothetical protein